MKGVHKVESRPCRNMSERVIGNIQSTRKNIHRMSQCTMLPLTTLPRARRRRCVQDGRPGSAWPRPLKVTGPLTPTNYLADKGLFNLAFSHLIGPVKVERLVESYDGIHISMDSMTQGGCSANIRRPPHVRNIPPACEGKTASTIPVLLNIVGESFGSGWWDAEEKTVGNDRERYRCIEILTDQNILLDIEVGWWSPA